MTRRRSENCTRPLELAHRRIRVEAAAALARLGETAGRQVLVGAGRRTGRAIARAPRAQELGLSDQMDPQYTTETARAEALVAVELAQPTFFGIPPVELQLVDARTQFWPGYEEPVRCYLFRYAYRFAAGEYSNVAIAGPLVHAFAADLSDLPPDESTPPTPGGTSNTRASTRCPWRTAARRHTRRTWSDWNAACARLATSDVRGPRWGISSVTASSWPTPRAATRRASP